MLRAIKRAIERYLKYRGKGLVCPICGRSARRFVPGKPSNDVVRRYNITSMGYREHHHCPWCNSTDKERRVWLYLRDKVLSAHSVLHIAPEPPTMAKLKAITPHYIAGDKFEGDERYNDGRYGDAINLDITDLPFADNSFDWVICNHVLEHVPDDRKGMVELFRVLKPGGTAVLQVPISYDIEHTIEGHCDDDECRLATFGQRDHVRIYGKDYAARLTDAGLSVSEQMEDLPVHGLVPGERLHVCRKI